MCIGNLYRCIILPIFNELIKFKIIELQIVTAYNGLELQKSDRNLKKMLFISFRLLLD